jgi:ribulose-phosphate 3-epimerase
MIKLAPSILSADFSKLGEEIITLSKSDCEYIHIDVMDGMFVPNISIGPLVVESIRPLTKQVFDVHLMINEPIRYIDKFASAGADIITVHYEACADLQGTIDAIKAHNIKVGLTIKPETPCEVLEPYISQIDMVLIMLVNPGFGGQQMIQSAVEKVTVIKALTNQLNPTCEIEVDGGVKLNNVIDVIEAGANVIVAGSSIFSEPGIEENIKLFRELLSKA